MSVVFDAKIAVIHRQDLATWQKLNVTAFTISGIAAAEGAEALAHALPDRLERLEAIGAAAGVKANALGRAMIDRKSRKMSLRRHLRTTTTPLRPKVPLPFT